MTIDHGPLDQEHLPENCAKCQADILRVVVNRQAEDGGLWFQAETAAEGYLQQELRDLHNYVESLLWAIDR